MLNLRRFDKSQNYFHIIIFLFFMWWQFAWVQSFIQISSILCSNIKNIGTKPIYNKKEKWKNWDPLILIKLKTHVSDTYINAGDGLNSGPEVVRLANVSA